MRCPNKCWGAKLEIYGHPMDPRRKYKCSCCGKIIKEEE